MTATLQAVPLDLLLFQHSFPTCLTNQWLRVRVCNGRATPEGLGYLQFRRGRFQKGPCEWGRFEHRVGQTRCQGEESNVESLQNHQVEQS